MWLRNPLYCIFDAELEGDEKHVQLYQYPGRFILMFMVVPQFVRYVKYPNIFMNPISVFNSDKRGENLLEETLGIEL